MTMLNPVAGQGVCHDASSHIYEAKSADAPNHAPKLLASIAMLQQT